MDHVTLPPLVAGGPDDYGATVVVVTYSLMFITLLLAGLRFHSTRRRKNGFSWDDLCFFAAVVSSSARALAPTSIFR